MTASISVEVPESELGKLIGMMEKEFPADLKESMRKANRRIELLTVSYSKARAPISPTKAQYEATLKRKKRSDRNDFNPGVLTRSIAGSSNDKFAKIYVPANSGAGKYADFIHYDMTYEYGVGTLAKGKLAGRLFISRAVQTLLRVGTYLRIYREELDKALAKNGVIEEATT
jgi:hypothetical protein